MMRPIAYVSVLLLASGYGSVTLDACGDKFLMVGRGLAFGRAYASVYPGSILIYSAPAQTPQQEKLQQNIQRAGHRVTLVDDERVLGQTLLLGQTDIVIADVRNKPTLDQQLASVSAKPSVLYLISERDKQRAAALQKESANTIKGGEKAGRFLVVIEEMMKSRQQAGVRVKRG